MSVSHIIHVLHKHNSPELLEAVEEMLDLLDECEDVLAMVVDNYDEGGGEDSAIAQKANELLERLK